MESLNTLETTPVHTATSDIIKILHLIKDDNRKVYGEMIQNPISITFSKKDPQSKSCSYRMIINNFADIHGTTQLEPSQSQEIKTDLELNLGNEGFTEITINY